MNIVKHRYSAEIQRSRGLLELAAALYDTSLSYQTERAAEQAMQTESRVGYSLTLALTATREKGISFSFAADGFRELQAVSRGALSLAWINPSVAATMAFKGKGLFSTRQPIRTVAVFPSYDVMGFAVHDSTGITSLEQIRKERIPLRVSTGTISKEWVKYSPTMFTVTAVMKAAGFTFADLRRWGGKIQSVTRPSHPDRRQALAIRWLIQAARSRNDKTMVDRLSAELMDAANNRGNAVKKREDTHRMAEANRAFSHYRW